MNIQNKDLLDHLIQKLAFRLGYRPKQHKVLEICLQLANDHIEGMITQLSPTPLLNDKKMKKIKQVARELKKVPWDVYPSRTFFSQDDCDLYLSQ